ncbi:MAG: universal stress protein [Terriglobia bacterium]|jgi:nucleotide-binding universal stress UspA family protein
MFKRILIAHDGSEGAKKAFREALILARSSSAELHSVSVKERPSHYAETVGEVMEQEEEADKFFAQVTSEATAQAREQGIDLQCTVLAGHEVETIVRFARDGQYDLLVVGFMGHSRAFGRIWGGTSQNLTKTAPCSVLVVK